MARQTPATKANDYAFEDEQGEHWGLRLLREVLEVAVLTLLLFAAVRLFVQNYRVDGPSMQPGLYTGQYILVDKAEYYLHPPQRGDVVVFTAPVSPPQDFVKRIIAVPGDSVFITPDAVVVDGTRLNEPYVLEQDANVPEIGDGCIDLLQVHLGSDQYLVLGDNRGNSEDSRCFGLIDRQRIVGKAALVYWPLSDLRAIKTYSSVFAAIHP
jgi:signal peptidase I